MIRISLSDLVDIYSMLPHPQKIKDGTFIGSPENPLETKITSVCGDKVKEICFKIRHINKYEVEWRPKEEIIIDNSDEEKFD